MVISCANSDAMEFGLILLLGGSVGSGRAVAQCVDFSCFVGFGSVDVVVKTGPGVAMTVCFLKRCPCSLLVAADAQ